MESSSHSLITKGSSLISVDQLSDAIIETHASSCASELVIREHLPENLKILDCTTGPGSSEAYKVSRLPGALFLDLNEKFIDPSGEYPTTFPTEEIVKKRLGELGISKNDQIVCYVTNDATRFATRWVYILKCYGFTQVAVLNGGMKKWNDNNYPIETTDPKEEVKKEFDEELEDASQYIVHYGDVKVLEKNTEDNIIIDARSKDEHEGKTAPPFKNAKAGKIPNSINIPSTDLLTRDGSFKSVDEIKEIFNKAGIDKHKKIVCHWNSGNQATIVTVALQEAGYTNVKLYDNSWSEYGSRLEE